MKRKIFSILFALVLVCSFSLVTAVPAGAQGAPIGDPFFTTSNLGTVEWSTEKATFGDYSAKLYIPPYDSGRLYDEARVVFNYDGDLNSIIGVSYPSYVIGGNDGDLYPMVVLAVDSTGDEEVDSWVCQWGPYNHTPLENAWETISFEGNSPVHVAGIRTGLPESHYLPYTNAFTESDTLDLLKVEWGDFAVLEVKVFMGAFTNLFEEMTAYVDDITINGVPYDLEPAVINTNTAEGFNTIQAAIDDADTIGGHTILVAAGTYAGAVVNEDLTITGAAGGGSFITSGVPYKVDSPLLTGFRLDADADGAEISNFTINGDYVNKFWFGVFARNANSVIVDSLTINDTVQGITNWGGSNWEITNNVITETYPTTGGGIAIYLGADPGDFPHCDNNLVQYNTMTTNRAQDSTFTGAAICLWFDMRYRSLEDLEGDESMTGNEIKDNSITASGLENQTGIEIGVGGLDGDNNPDKVAACLGVIHDNTVTNNTIDNAEWGLYLYVTTNLTVQGNTVKNCSDCGIYMKDDHANCLINYNDIYGNTNYGLNNTDGATYSTTVNATYNWWGDVAGPKTDPGGILHNPYENWTEGDAVSNNVDYMPWLIQTELQEDWNIYSMPIAPDEACLEPFMDALLSANVTAAYYFDSDNQSWGIPEDEGSLDAVYLKMKNPVTVNIWASSWATFPSQKEMKVGWNFVGLAELHPMPAPMALASALFGTGEAGLWGYSQVISPSLNGAYWTYMRAPDQIRLDEPLWLMFPTKGYWVFMVNDGVLGGFTSTPIVEVAEPIPGPRS